MTKHKGTYWDHVTRTFLTWEEFMARKHPKVAGTYQEEIEKRKKVVKK